MIVIEKIANAYMFDCDGFLPIIGIRNRNHKTKRSPGKELPGLYHLT